MHPVIVSTRDPHVSPTGAVHLPPHGIGPASPPLFTAFRRSPARCRAVRTFPTDFQGAADAARGGWAAASRCAAAARRGRAPPPPPPPPPRQMGARTSHQFRRPSTRSSTHGVGWRSTSCSSAGLRSPDPRPDAIRRHVLLFLAERARSANHAGLCLSGTSHAPTVVAHLWHTASPSSPVPGQTTNSIHAGQITS